MEETRPNLRPEWTVVNGPRLIKMAPSSQTVSKLNEMVASMVHFEIDRQLTANKKPADAQQMIKNRI